MLHGMWGSKTIQQLSTDTGAFASFEIHLRDYKTLLELKTQKGHFRTLSSDRFIDYNWLQIPQRYIFPLGPSHTDLFVWQHRIHPSQELKHSCVGSQIC